MVSEEFHKSCDEEHCEDTTYNMTGFEQSGSGATQGGATPWIEAYAVVRQKQAVNDSM